jgi:hypothetical protein
MARIRIPIRARDRKKDLLEIGRICLLGTTKITTNREIAEGRCGLGCVYPASAAEIIKTLDRELLTVRGAHRRTGIGAAGSSRIRNADLGRFTVDRLMSIINRLGSRVEGKTRARRAETAARRLRPFATGRRSPLVVLP